MMVPWEAFFNPLGISELTESGIFEIVRMRRFQIWYLKEAWRYFIDIKIFNLDLNGSLCSEWVKNWLTGLEIYDGLCYLF